MSEKHRRKKKSSSYSSSSDDDVRRIKKGGRKRKNGILLMKIHRQIQVIVIVLMTVLTSLKRNKGIKERIREESIVVLRMMTAICQRRDQEEVRRIAQSWDIPHLSLRMREKMEARGMRKEGKRKLLMIFMV